MPTSMNIVNGLTSLSLASLSLFFSTAIAAKEIPLESWKSIMDNVKTQYDNGNITGACTNAINLAHFMNTEIYNVRNNKQLQQDVTFLMWDWQTYVGKYCGGRPLVKKSRLWNELQ